MGVMTAGVHHTRSSRAIRNIVFFLDRQGIDIRSQSDDRRSRFGRFDDIGDNAALSRGYSMRNLGGVKLFAEIIRGREFFTAKLGVPMEVTANL